MRLRLFLRGNFSQKTSLNLSLIHLVLTVPYSQNMGGILG